MMLTSLKRREQILHTLATYTTDTSRTIMAVGHLNTYGWLFSHLHLPPAPTCASEIEHTEALLILLVIYMAGNINLDLNYFNKNVAKSLKTHH